MIYIICIGLLVLTVALLLMLDHSKVALLQSAKSLYLNGREDERNG